MSNNNTSINATLNTTRLISPGNRSAPSTPDGNNNVSPSVVRSKRIVTRTPSSSIGREEAEEIRRNARDDSDDDDYEEEDIIQRSATLRQQQQDESSSDEEEEEDDDDEEEGSSSSQSSNMMASDYFSLHKPSRRGKKTATSSATLADLGIAIPSASELNSIYKSLPDPTRKDRDALMQQYEKEFPHWEFFLKTGGFNLLFYGFGSKSTLMHRFADQYCRDAICIHIQGFHPVANIKEVLNLITEQLFRERTRRFKTHADHVQAIKQMFAQLHGVDIYGRTIEPKMPTPEDVFAEFITTEEEDVAEVDNHAQEQQQQQQHESQEVEEEQEEIEPQQSPQAKSPTIKPTSVTTTTTTTANIKRRTRTAPPSPKSDDSYRVKEEEEDADNNDYENDNEYEYANQPDYDSNDELYGARSPATTPQRRHQQRQYGEMSLNKYGIGLYLIIDNIDGPGLRDERAQEVLCSLATIKELRILASVDHINSFLLWSETKLTRFNFLYANVTTLEPYERETSFSVGSVGRAEDSTKRTGIFNIIESFTTKQKQVFRIIVQHQLEHQDGPGITKEDLLNKCKHHFLVTSDAELMRMLSEMRDHQIVQGYARQVQYFRPTLDAETLQRVVDFIPPPKYN